MPCSKIDIELMHNVLVKSDKVQSSLSQFHNDNLSYVSLDSSSLLCEVLKSLIGLSDCATSIFYCGRCEEYLETFQKLTEKNGIVAHICDKHFGSNSRNSNDSIPFVKSTYKHFVLDVNEEVYAVTINVISFKIKKRPLKNLNTSLRIRWILLLTH